MVTSLHGKVWIKNYKKWLYHIHDGYVQWRPSFEVLKSSSCVSLII